MTVLDYDLATTMSNYPNFKVFTSKMETVLRDVGHLIEDDTAVHSEFRVVMVRVSDKLEIITNEFSPDEVDIVTISKVTDSLLNLFYYRCKVRDLYTKLEFNTPDHSVNVYNRISYRYRYDMLVASIYSYEKMLVELHNMDSATNNRKCFKVDLIFELDILIKQLNSCCTNIDNASNFYSINTVPIDQLMQKITLTLDDTKNKILKNVFGTDDMLQPILDLQTYISRYNDEISSVVEEMKVEYKYRNHERS
jgi:hypothetical protein